MTKSYAALLALLVSVSSIALTLPSAQAVDAQAALAKPERALHERPPGGHGVTFNSYALKGRVQEPQADGTLLPYAKGKLLLQKRECKTCAWKPNKMLKTDGEGRFRTLIFVPRDGRWFWRVRINGSDGFATTTGRVWGTGSGKD